MNLKTGAIHNLVLGLFMNPFPALVAHLFSGSESDRPGRNAGFVLDPEDSGLDLVHAGMPDAGMPDAGMPDAGMPDAGTLAAGECLP